MSSAVSRGTFHWNWNERPIRERKLSSPWGVKKKAKFNKYAVKNLCQRLVHLHMLKRQVKKTVWWSFYLLRFHIHHARPVAAWSIHPHITRPFNHLFTACCKVCHDGVSCGCISCVENSFQPFKVPIKCLFCHYFYLIPIQLGVVVTLKPTDGFKVAAGEEEDSEKQACGRFIGVVLHLKLLVGKMAQSCVFISRM